MVNTTKLFKEDEEAQKPGNVSDDTLRDITGISPQEEADYEQAAQNDTEDADGADLSTQESKAGTSTKTDGSSGADGKKSTAGDLSEAENSDKLGKGFTGGFKFDPINGSKLNFSSGGKKKLILFGSAGLGTSLVIFVLILILIASTLQIPNLAQHITAYEFARVTRQFATSASRVNDEKLVLDAANDGKAASLYNQVKNKYGDAKGKVSKTWSALDAYRPAKVIQNMGSTNGLTLTYEGQRFVGGTLNGSKFEVKPIGNARFIPGLNQVLTFKNQATFARDFVPTLTESMRTNDVGPIIRGITARQLRQQLGISLVAWNLAKFQDKDTVKARLEAERQKVAVIDEGKVPDTMATEELQRAKEAGKAAVDDAIANDDELAKAIKNGGVVESSRSAVNSILEDSGLKAVLGFVNPLYAVAVPFCIVYDGSLIEAGPSINNNTAQLQRSYVFINAAAHEQKQGTSNKTDAQNLAKAVKATNESLGNISQSNAEILASGGTIDTTKTNTSAEAGAMGVYTLFNATPGLSNYADILNGVRPYCQALTNTGLAVAIGAANLIAVIGSGGTFGAGEEAASAASDVVIQTASKSLAERFALRFLSNQSANTIAQTTRISKILYGTGKSALKQAAAIAAATVLAKSIVATRAGDLTTGLAQGTDLANNAHSGGNIMAGELSRKQTFAGPMTYKDTAVTDVQDKATVLANAESKSFTDRYFATSNADSLLSRMAISTSATFSDGTFKALSRIASSVLNPINTFASVFRPLIAHTHAAPDPSTQHYGNVQFGWTPSEELLIAGHSSYSPLENQAILDQSGAEARIAQKYAVCFGYTSDDQGNLTMEPTNDGDGSLGSLLAKGLIVRNENGDVVANEGLCAPNNLSYDSPDDLAVDTSGGPKAHDMIFRWRLAQRYATTIQQLTDTQDVTP